MQSIHSFTQALQSLQIVFTGSTPLTRELTHQELHGLPLEHLQLLKVLQQPIVTTGLCLPRIAAKRMLLASTLPACRASRLASLGAARHKAAASAAMTDLGVRMPYQRSLRGSAGHQRFLGHLHSQPGTRISGTCFVAFISNHAQHLCRTPAHESMAHPLRTSPKLRGAWQQ